MDNEYGNIELSGPVDSFSISSLVNLDCSDVGVSCDPDSVWIPSTGFFQFYLVTVSHSNCLIYWSLLDFIFKTFDLSEIHGMLTAYINMCSGVFPDIFEKYSLNTYPSWP